MTGCAPPSPRPPRPPPAVPVCPPSTLQGSNSDITAQLLGLSVKAQTRLLKDAAATAAKTALQHAERGGADSSTSSSSAAGSSQPGDRQQQQQQCHEVATSILEPCDVKVALKSSEAVQDVNVDVSTVQLRMSPDVLHLLQHLQQVAAEPLAVPPPDQPLARVDRFACLWSSHGPAEGAGAAGPPYATAGAGGVAVISSDKGVTVWRPQPPVGYAIVGDVLAAGTSCGQLGACGWVERNNCILGTLGL